MEEIEMFKVLNRIKICIENDSLINARELIRLEIDNLNGITERRCKNTKYYYYK